MRGLLVTSDQIVDVEYEGFEDIQRLIGCECFTSASFVFDNHPACYVDDEGLINGSKPNRAIYRNGKLIYVAHGNMLFVGLNDDGSERDINIMEDQRVRMTFGGGDSGPGSGRAAIEKLVRPNYNETEEGRVKRKLKARGKM